MLQHCYVFELYTMYIYIDKIELRTEIKRPIHPRLVIKRQHSDISSFYSLRISLDYWIHDQKNKDTNTFIKPNRKQIYLSNV